MTAARRRLIGVNSCEQFNVSQRRVSRALALPRSSLRYSPVARDEQATLARRIEELAGTHPRFGYRRIWALLVREGWSVNKKAVRRIWRLSGLRLAGPRAKPKPRRPHGQDVNACHLRPSRGKDDVWTWDFLFDRTSDGRSLKWLSLVDEYTRECLALEARRGMTAEEIRAILAGVAAGRGGPPHRVRSDNGPEFAAEVVRVWLEGTGSGTLYVAPASPWQNGYAESFHSKLRDEFLDREEFESEPQAQALGTLWKEEYNTERPHSSLGYKTPAEFAATCARYVPIEDDPPEPDPPVTEQPHL
jgi:putative transposase